MAAIMAGALGMEQSEGQMRKMPFDQSKVMTIELPGFEKIIYADCPKASKHDHCVCVIQESGIEISRCEFLMYDKEDEKDYCTWEPFDPDYTGAYGVGR